MLKSLTLLVYIALLYVCFLTNGLYEEKIFKVPLEVNGSTYKFKYPTLTIFMNSFFCLLISYTFIKIFGKGAKSPLTFFDKTILGLYNIGCKYSNDYSLNYLDYITRIIGKSCKSISIILVYFLYKVPGLNKLIKFVTNIQDKGSEVHHSGFGDLFKVVITTSSIILFNLEDSAESKTDSSKIYIGYILLVVSLLFDGLIAIKEKVVNHIAFTNDEFKESRNILAWEYMFSFNIFTFAITISLLGYGILTSDLKQELAIFILNPEFRNNLLISSVANSLGQVFIFQIIEKYGPLTLSIVTGVRKILTIVVSIFYFQKSLGLIKICSLILGSGVIVWEVIEKSIKPHHHSHGGHGVQPKVDKKKD